MELVFKNIADCIDTLILGRICDDCNGSAIFAILAIVIQILTGLIAIAATIGIVIAGITYLTSSDNVDKQIKARSRIFNIALGLGFYAISFTLINFLIPGGIINHEISSEETSQCSGSQSDDDTEPPKDDEDTPEDDEDIPEDDEHAHLEGDEDQPENPTYVVKNATYKNKNYQYVEAKNAIPYVYTQSTKITFTKRLSRIETEKDESNILIIANAGEFNTDNYTPVGVTIENGKTITNKKAAHPIFVVDEDGNVGFADKSATASSLKEGTASYTSGLTNEQVTGKKIVSAVTGFSPIVISGEIANEYSKEKSHYSNYRERQIICIKKDKTYVMISNKNDGEANGGWNFNDMAKVSIERGCYFAYNMDGGGSTAIGTRTNAKDKFNIYRSGNRKVPTYIVFTSDNKAPTK